MSNLTGDTIAPPALTAWMGRELAKARAATRHEPGGMLLGCAVWGAAYISIFARFCVSSLLSARNRAALARNDARFVFWTDPAGREAVRMAAAPLAKAGFRVEIEVIRHDLLEGCGLHKFMVVSAAHNLLMYRAAIMGRGIHALCPDHVYSERYFEGMGDDCPHDAIVHGAVSADVAAAVTELKQYQRGEALEIPAEDLGSFGVKHLHQQMQACLRRPGDPMPRSQTLLWAGKDALHFAGPIMNPVWLSAKRCRLAPILYPVTFDAEVHALTGGEFHIPGPEEGMVLVELSRQSKAPVAKAANIGEWLGLVWLQMNFKSENLAIYRRRTAIPTRPNPDGLEVEAIEREHAELMADIPPCKVEAMEGYFEMIQRHGRPFLRS